MKTDYLVAYDYGQGAVWAVIHANSGDEIVRKFPDLRVIESRPPWVTEQEYAQIKSENYMDIDNKPTGWFSNLKYKP